MRITFLGTGTSHGVPMIACDCPVCRSNDPKNKRTRTSILVSYNGRNILVDTTPELRIQTIRCDVRRVDAVLFTHHHADHLHGLDDLRRFSDIQRMRIPCYGNEKTIRRIETVFDYAIKAKNLGGGIPRIETHVIKGEFELFGLRICPLKLLHGRMEILGYRFEDVAYATDCSAIPTETAERMRGLKLLILDALRFRPHPTHFNISQALEVVERLKPERTLFVHMTHDVDHHTTNAMLPDGVELAYDGMVVEI
ncbi:TPA: MBL fold metallo-hydrolase [Candidatus Poribacteria bacterium]|nr:MBL fold metallo-hydrolase [Candidatus Poribacteria bacterium]